MAREDSALHRARRSLALPDMPRRTLLFLALGLLPLAGQARPPQPDLADVAQAIVEQTNDLRRSQGLAPTAANRQLGEAARYFAEYMARTDQYGHEADGSRPEQRALAKGYTYCLVSENIAYQFSTAGFAGADLARRFVDGWKQSPPHRHNMLEADAVETGVAVAHSTRSGHYYAVQMFGRPAALRVAFRIANRSPARLHYELGGQTFDLPPRVTRTHEQCRADLLRLRLPGERQPVTIEPTQGGRYVVERSASRFEVVQGRDQPSAKTASPDDERRR
ncbi:MAG TPA: CAP domain-containing protein [Albitalea sp.]|nr:CAP domain-containing protein [Albitalea sp.]